MGLVEPRTDNNRQLVPDRRFKRFNRLKIWIRSQSSILRHRCIQRTQLRQMELWWQRHTCQNLWSMRFHRKRKLQLWSGYTQMHDLWCYRPCTRICSRRSQRYQDNRQQRRRMVVLVKAFNNNDMDSFHHSNWWRRWYQQSGIFYRPDKLQNRYKFHQQQWD